jgi:hypothetical protein
MIFVHVQHLLKFWKDSSIYTVIVNMIEFQYAISSATDYEVICQLFLAKVDTSVLTEAYLPFIASTFCSCVCEHTDTHAQNGGHATARASHVMPCGICGRWTKWYWDVFPVSTSVYLANSHPTYCPTFIILSSVLCSLDTDSAIKRLINSTVMLTPC